MGPSPSRFEAQLLLLGELYEQEPLEALLTALEGIAELAPNQWGIARAIRDPYDHAALVSAMLAEPHEVFPHVYRTLPPVEYSASILSEVVVSSFGFESRGSLTEQELERAIGAFSTLASELPVEWGHIAPVFEQVSREDRIQVGGNFTHLGHYLRHGPCCLFPRTFVGPRVLSLIGPGVDPLQALGLDATRLKNGVLQLDLVPRPWASDPATLKRAQERAHAKLAPAEVLGSMPLLGPDTPGRRWKPPGNEAVSP